MVVWPLFNIYQLRACCFGSISCFVSVSGCMVPLSSVIMPSIFPFYTKIFLPTSSRLFHHIILPLLSFPFGRIVYFSIIWLFVILRFLSFFSGGRFAFGECILFGDEGRWFLWHRLGVRMAIPRFATYVNLLEYMFMVMSSDEANLQCSLKSCLFLYKDVCVCGLSENSFMLNL